MKQKYRIIVLGDIPRDLKERIASIHTAALLSLKNADAADHPEGQNNQRRAAQL